MGRDNFSFAQFVGWILFQSTRPRGARQGPALQARTLFGVSIHAPAWGATRIVVLSYSLVHVSIHAPAWGATAALASTAGGVWRFNPRARVGRDLQELHGRSASICFNPRARVGRDRCRQASCPWPAGFNPRARVGRDRERGFKLLRYACVSIHAPAWGATVRRQARGDHLEVSIHAPAWGATIAADLDPLIPLGFNPRARVGRDKRGRVIR